MGIALENPNDRRRLNLMARAVVQHGMTPEAAVTLMKTVKSAPAFRKAKNLKRGGAQAVSAGIAAGKKMSDADKTATDEDSYARKCTGESSLSWCTASSRSASTPNTSNQRCTASMMNPLTTEDSSSSRLTAHPQGVSW